MFLGVLTVERVQIEPFRRIHRFSRQLAYLLDEQVIVHLDPTLIASKCFVTERWSPYSSSSIMETLVASGVHACSWVVSVIPGRFAALTVRRRDYLCPIGIGNTEIVRANADKTAIFLVQSKELVMAIEFGIAEDGVEFADAGEEWAGDFVQWVDEDSVDQ